MSQTDISKYSVGVLVARFQVHELHEGHHYIIKQVMKNHKKTIIFLGVPKFVGTKKNPLDFDARKKMVQHHYPDAVIVALPDNRDNKKWAHELDRRIREIYQHGDVLLYGSRDSFIPYYVNNGGKFQTEELKQLGSFTGTDVRRMISEEVRNSVDFRSGVIYHAYNLYPRVIPTVDIAPMRNNRTEVLIMRNYDEDRFRFIGGFVKPTDNHLKESVRRIHAKKAGSNSTVGEITWIDSVQIDDWRYRGEEDRIMTSFFAIDLMWGTIEPGEDVAELKWTKIDKGAKDELVEEHHILLEKLMEHTNKEKE